MYVEARIPIIMTSPRMQVIATCGKRKDIKHITIGLGLLEHQDFKVIATTARSMVIELLSADQSLCDTKSINKDQKPWTSLQY